MMPALLLIIAALLRLPILLAPMWYDENYTLILSRLPFLEMLTATAGDVHPPLWYIITWTLYRIPNLPEWAIRLPAFGLGVLAVWLYMQLLKRLPLPEIVRGIALGVFVLAPMQIQYSVEGRMYALLLVLTLTGALFVLDRKPFHLLPVLIALCYTHNWGLLYAAALGLWLFIVTAKEIISHRVISQTYDLRPMIPVVSVGILTVLAWLPWAGIMLNQLGMIQGMYWITRVTPGMVMYQVYEQLAGAFFPHPSGMIPFYTLLAVGLLHSIQQRNYFTAWMFAAPMTLAIVISITMQPILLYRAMIGVAPFTYILIAYAAAHLWQSGKLEKALLIALVLPLVSMYQPLYTDASKYGLQEEIALVADVYQPGDLIIAPGDTGVINMAPYFPQTVYLLEECAPSRGALTAQTRTAMGYETISLSGLQTAPRVIVVWGRHPLMDACEIAMLETLLAPADRIYYQVDFPGLMERGVYVLEN